MQRVHQLEDLGVFESVKFLNFAKQVEILVNAPSEEEARQAVESLPLHAYFQYNLQPANAQQEAALTRKQPVRDMLRYLGLKH
jgi:hypothetical protein